ncbi:metallophosphoesterase [Alicyclobacillus fastidiosus]|uniref:Phosphoesterase n=1 Tax=Alicyclobacillus fastidiosus TaxID=392011 RepID=A0ABY6ZN13_9BACL|nr:metallophosphoesterase [Alicyclobacillus fastidiosus]WAH44229.1 metallophosphoesterase [Alicyclobacillus fastidiosus]GMA60548.1 phosphoesterase [Alicyclobacillus fastidiosus]
MKLCIVSDTHGRTDELHAAALIAGDVDVFLHAGDETADAAWLASYMKIPVVGVAGNWDKPSVDYPLERIVSVDDVPLFLAHGHRLQVTESLQPLVARAESMGARIAVYGHTHVLHAGVHDDVLVVNPGSLALPRGGTKGSFVRLTSTAVPGGFVRYLVEHLTTTAEIISKFEFVGKK